MRIDELMTRDVVTVSPWTPLKDVARLLTEHRISGLPVCGSEGDVVGVVSEADILRKEEGIAPQPGGVLDWIFERPDGDDARLFARIAGEAMTTPAVTIAPDATVAEAARAMARRGINRLPVVADGRLVGIVTRADLVRAFQRTDDEIERELAEDVLLRTLWLSPEDVELSVADGVVEVAGRVDNRTQAELVVAYARRVPGVVAVHSRLTWRVDDRARRTALARRPVRI